MVAGTGQPSKGPFPRSDLKEKYQTVAVEITTVDTPLVSHKAHINGWGQDARGVIVEGKAVEILVRRGVRQSNGTDAEFGIRILENGDIIITSYNSLLTTSLHEHNLRLTNERPWKGT